MNLQNVSFMSVVNPLSVNRRSVQQDDNTVKQGFLEYSPAVDTVSFKGKNDDAEKDYKNYSCKDADMLKYDLEFSKPSFFNRGYDIVGDDVELVVKNKMGGVQNISGEAYENAVDVNIDSGLFGVRKGSAKGVIGDKNFELEYRANENSKNIKIKGDIEHLDDNEKALLLMLISDKIKYDVRVEQELEMVALASTLGQ